MPVLLFSLRSVPDDEAEKIRQLLTSNRIEFYETPAGRWGISSPGIWLHDGNQLPKARSLIETYQKERFASRRQEFVAVPRALSLEERERARSAAGVSQPEG